DLRGNLATTTDPAGNTTYSYIDSLGRRYKIVDPDTGTTTDQFDNVGQIISETDALGQVTQFRYDALGRATSRTTLAGTPSASTVTWSYDERAGAGYANIGHLTSMADASGVETSDFNAAGLLTKRARSINGQVYTFYYAYDAG